MIFINDSRGGTLLGATFVSVSFNSVKRSLLVFLNFLGLDMADGKVVRGAHFSTRIGLWETSNHDWLRITRMLKSLRLLGLEKEAGEVWKCLRKLHEDGYVSENSFGYWSEAAEGLETD